MTVSQNISQRGNSKTLSVTFRFSGPFAKSFLCYFAMIGLYLLPSNVFGQINVDKDSLHGLQICQTDSVYTRALALLEEGARLYGLGDYNKGLGFFSEAYKGFESINVEDYRLFCLNCIRHGYIMTGRTDEVPELEEMLFDGWSSYMDRVLSGMKEEKSIDNFDGEIFLFLTSTIATMLQDHDMTAESIQLRNMIYKVETKYFSSDPKRMFSNLYSLAWMYIDCHDLENAQETIDKWNDLVTDNDGLETECVRFQLLQCVLYNRTGNIGAAIELCERIEAMAYQTGDFMIVADYLNTYSRNLSAVGNFARALEIDQQQLPIIISAYGKDSRDCAITLLNMSEMYSVCNQHEQALQTNLEALDIMERLFGKESKNYYLAFSRLSSKYRHIDINEYWEMRKECISLSKSIFGEKSAEYADALIYSADLLPSATNEDIVKLETGIAIKEELALTSDNFYLSQLSWLPVLYRLKNEWRKALDTSNKVLARSRDFVASNFTKLIDWQREGLWQSVDGCVNGFLSNAISYSNYAVQSGDTTLLDEYGGLAFNTVLLRKGLLLYSSLQLENMLKSSADQRVLKLREEINDLNYAIKNVTHDSEQYRTISKKKDETQRELLRVAAELGDFMAFIDIDWRDVQAALSPGEVAVEFFSFPVLDQEPRYGAVWITSTRNPTLSTLFNGDVLKAYELRDESIYDYNNPGLYKTIWGALEDFPDFRNCKTVYFSASDILNTINIECLKDSTGVMACDKVNLYRLSSTRELVTRRERPAISSAVLYGGLNYKAGTEDIAEVNEKYGHAMNGRSWHNRSVDAVRSHRGAMEYLAGTMSEVKNIENTIGEKPQTQCLVLTGNEGTEESFYSLNDRSVNLLHISTHGFYFDETDVEDRREERNKYRFMMFDDDKEIHIEDKAMTQSGLILSGANTALCGLSLPEGMEDGILTSQEISSVNLEGLDLVVLSACQTGLGKVSSEGVFGLQRGFKRAGANSILMSLWKVDDKATQMLMVEFYRHFLDGESKVESLKKAQQHVKSQPGYEDPEYWAGFILLDALN